MLRVEPQVNPKQTMLGVCLGLLGVCSGLTENLQLFTSDNSDPTPSNPEQPRGCSGLARGLISCFSVIEYEVCRSSVFGQRPQRGRSPVEHRGTFVCPFVCLFVPPPHQAPQASNLASDQASHASNMASQASNMASQASNPAS